MSSAGRRSGPTDCLRVMPASNHGVSLMSSVASLTASAGEA
jgi:hypothetical protein